MNSVLDPNYIRPFVEGTLTTMKLQCNVIAIFEKPYLSTESVLESLNIGIMGVVVINDRTVQGSVCVCFPEKTFLLILGSMLGETFASLTSDVEDGAGELTNIIFGSAKKILNERGHSIEKSLPKVVSGKGLLFYQPPWKPTIILPFKTDKGPFHVQIGLSLL
jgi:chemotaxis protein CheX